MKQTSNKSSIQNITLSNLLNRLESLSFCTYAETKEYYETLRARLLPQKLKFWTERKFGNDTVSEEYFINWKLFTKSMPVLLKIRFHKKQTESSNTKRLLTPGTLKVPFLTLTLMTLNFEYYRKDWNVNSSKKKYHLYKESFKQTTTKLTMG